MLKRGLVVMTMVGFAASLMAADLPADKLKELKAMGITKWVPGQNKGKKAMSRVKAKAAPKTIATTGTLQYDNGTISALPSVTGQVYGNQFKRYVGTPGFSPITLNSFMFYFMEDSTADTDMYFQPADPVDASHINARASQNVTGLANSGLSFSNPVLNTINQTALGTTGVFGNTMYLGAWNYNGATTFPVTNECIGLASNTHAGGFHGYTAVSMTGTKTMTPQSFQAILRVNITSPQTVPVELMNVEVEK